MEIFKTGMQVTRAVKNIQRLRQIVGTFAKHGFAEVFQRAGLGAFGAKNKLTQNNNLTVPERLRCAFEELGPTFVKLGQILSNRPDLIPDAFIEEFKKLQDDVLAVPFDVMKGVIEAELKQPLHNVFSYFNETPIAAASIGQVYEARLHSGEHVVVKVQRPEIEKIVKNDISIMLFLAESLEKYVPETKILSPVNFVEEFFTTLNYEMDFLVEANNILKFYENFKNDSRVVIPKVYKTYSTHKLLVMEKLNGIKITDIEKLKAKNIDPKKLVQIGASVFFKMVVIDGLFHGDLHGGNIFAIQDGSETKIGLIDFGIVGRLSPSSRQSFTRMCAALITEDYETLCYEYADLGAVGSGVDFDAFQREVRNALAPYMGLSLSDVNMGQVLIKSTRIAVKYNIRIPSDWMIVFKAIFSLEGLGKQLDPDFDFLSMGQDLIKSAVKDKISLTKAIREFNWLSRDVLALLEVAPRQLRWMMKKFNSNDFAFEIKFKEFENFKSILNQSSKKNTQAILVAGLFIASALSLNFQGGHSWKGYPLPSLIFFIAGVLGMIRILFK
jgi:ubiquinone biosynthesis protein